MQIFFEPEQQKWVTTTYIDGKVRLYDSIFNGRLSQSTEYQMYADAAKEGSIHVFVVPVQQQIGNSICGVMAIANGYHAICGDKHWNLIKMN